MTEQIIAYAKKQGWNIGLVLIIIWQNSRIDKVERMLFTCYTQLNVSMTDRTTDKADYFVAKYAILPCNPTGKRKKYADNKNNC